ncbi:MAG: PTS sugar transporter subunit IIA [Kiritimatiellae bacterium]|nr:PTS sugar transporter subunit IIA [Kiritimatiellia bacterium]
MPYRMFNLDEVADYLHIQKDEVEEMVRSNLIPHERQGPRVVFRQKDVDTWATRRILGLPKKDLTSFHKKTSAKAHDLSQQHAIIPELMRAEWIEPGLSSRTKPSLIRDMVKLARKTGLLIHESELVQTLTQREQMASTALAGGIALLHPEHHRPYMFEDSFVVLGRAVQPVPFGSPDGQTSDLFFLICCQDDRIHLHVLARLCMMCHHTSLLLDLREAAGREEMYRALVAAENEVIKGL